MCVRSPIHTKCVPYRYSIVMNHWAHHPLLNANNVLKTYERSKYTCNNFLLSISPHSSSAVSSCSPSSSFPFFSPSFPSSLSFFCYFSINIVCDATSTSSPNVTINITAVARAAAPHSPVGCALRTALIIHFTRVVLPACTRRSLHSMLSFLHRPLLFCPCVYRSAGSID